MFDDDADADANTNDDNNVLASVDSAGPTITKFKKRFRQFQENIKRGREIVFVVTTSELVELIRFVVNQSATWTHVGRQHACMHVKKSNDNLVKN